MVQSACDDEGVLQHRPSHDTVYSISLMRSDSFVSHGRCESIPAVQAREDATELKAQSAQAKADVAAAEEASSVKAAQRDEAILPIGNLVHDSVPVDDDEVLFCSPLASQGSHLPTDGRSVCYTGVQVMTHMLHWALSALVFSRTRVRTSAAACRDVARVRLLLASAAQRSHMARAVAPPLQANNAVVKEWGAFTKEARHKHNHVDLVNMLGIVDLENGTVVAGGRGYYLKGAGVLLNQALINCAIQHAYKRGSEPIQTPFFMRKSIMAECAQLKEFDEALYHVRCAALFDDALTTLCTTCALARAAPPCFRGAAPASPRAARRGREPPRWQCARGRPPRGPCGH